MSPSHIHVPTNCRTVTEILSRVGDKWSVQVVVQMGEGPKRFNELRRSVTGISQRMLTLTLRGLERDGLVTRTVYPTIPPRVDYQLTGLGCSLLKTVRGLGEWAIQNRDEILEARRRFDEGDTGSGTGLRSRVSPVRTPKENRPAALAALMPDGESSKATASSALMPSRASAVR
jgi:DNA-binding HxlR family transcriptional regulator